jgi:protein-disulfide isomerase
LPVLPSLRSSAGLWSRRRLLQVSASAVALSAAAAWGLTAPASAQRRKGSAPAEVSVDELMKPGALPDMVFGSAEAPVTVVEYASMTCGHCANFHNKVLPKIKEKYIDPGKVRWILREFPLDDRATAASVLARCTGDDKVFPFVSALFAKQDDWAFVNENSFVPSLMKFGKQAGFTEDSFKTCLRDQKLMDAVLATRERAATEFGVNSTPTFFINGKRLAGAPTVEEFEKAFASVSKS